MTCGQLSHFGTVFGFLRLLQPMGIAGVIFVKPESRGSVLVFCDENLRGGFVFSLTPTYLMPNAPIRLPPV